MPVGWHLLVYGSKTQSPSGAGLFSSWVLWETGEHVEETRVWAKRIEKCGKRQRKDSFKKVSFKMFFLYICWENVVFFRFTSNASWIWPGIHLFLTILHFVWIVCCDPNVFFCPIKVDYLSWVTLLLQLCGCAFSHHESMAHLLKALRLKSE